MNKPLLSVYLPVYNHSEIIEGNLEFMAQEIRATGALYDIEVVVSDNVSTDDTGEKVKAFIKANTDLNIVYKRNDENIGGIRNIACLWNKTTGSYVIMIGDDSFAKGGLVGVYSSLKENQDADIIILKNNTYTDFEYTKNATMADVVRNIQKLEYIGNFVLKRDHFGFDFDNCDIDFSNAYPHMIMIMNRITDANIVIDTRFIAINIAVSWNFQQTIKIIFKLQIDCFKIFAMVKDRLDEKSYKLLIKNQNRSLYNSFRYIRGYKNRFNMFRYLWNELPVKSTKNIVSLVLHCLPAPLFYSFKLLDTGFKYFKYCIQEIKQNHARWKDESFNECQDHVDDKYHITDKPKAV
jgi:glycosyltransferase involved in cell wall biosynthesis